MEGTRHHLSHNWVTLLGAVMALVAGFAILFLLTINYTVGIKNPYLGIMLYMVLPMGLVAGLLLIPLGMYVRWRLLQKGGVITFIKWPYLDLNLGRHRKAALIFVAGTLLFVLISSVGIYEGYHYTDSVSFCGLTCHKVMKPEHTTYQDSPHARVKCVACHIGPGVGWYAKSKLSGLYQVYATIADIYPRPIPTPIENLRPARETCEQCHWPRQFYGAQQRQFDHYMYDRDNTHWPVNMLIKTGGGTSLAAQTTGIHWHMNIAMEVEYIARDERRQDIPWVKVTEMETGRITIYHNTESPLSAEEQEALEHRKMDCMDCHNRPSHNFHSPDYEIDIAILSGGIDRRIPDIKRVSVEAMSREYETEPDASSGIASYVTEFYRTEYPDFYTYNRVIINEAIKAVQAAYLGNVFPSMNASWADYPNDIGHFIFPGCMRCHDGRHRSGNGLLIPADCRTCHIILSQGSGERAQMANTPEGLEFSHPVDIGEAWRGGACHQCHTGSRP
jgi:nitrate/TMAO reductase-like tetraheme cytochrome c subunit